MIRPLNPLKIKHRERTCVLLSLLSGKGRLDPNTSPEGVVEYLPEVALVRFADTRRKALVDTSDLDGPT